MKYLSQITIITAVSFLGELLAYLIPLPVPGSIYGLVIMFILLLMGAIRVPQVKDVGEFLITLMPIMFVAPVVGLIGKFDSCRTFILPLLICATVGTFIVMAVTGVVSQMLINIGKKGDDGDAE